MIHILPFILTFTPNATCPNVKAYHNTNSCCGANTTDLAYLSLTCGDFESAWTSDCCSQDTLDGSKTLGDMAFEAMVELLKDEAQAFALKLLTGCPPRIRKKNFSLLGNEISCN